MLKSILIMATHIMEKQTKKQLNHASVDLALRRQQNTARVSQFVAYLSTGLFTETMDLFDRLDQQQAFAEGMLGFLNYDWPILNSKSQRPIEASIEQTLTSVM